MSTDNLTGSSGQPPSYNDATEDQNDSIIQPAILVLAGQSVHAESAASAPLYEVNRGIATLSNATSEVEFNRVERTVKATRTGEPSIKSRQQEIYKLMSMGEHTRLVKKLMFVPESTPSFYIKAVSRRRTLGNIGLKKEKRLFQDPRWLALPVDLSGKRSEYGLPTFINDSKALFDIRRKDGRWTWSDADGALIAMEDDADNQFRLIVTRALHRETLDALVALWCCRIWQDSADSQEKVHEGMEGGKHRTTGMPAHSRVKSLT